MDNDTLKNKIQQLLPILNEKQKRLFLASEAKSLGYGGISKISKLSGISRPTISLGIKELNSTNYIDQDNTVRSKGGGAKAIHRENKNLKKQIEKIIEPATTGDPMSPLMWTIKSTREIEKEPKKRKSVIYFKFHAKFGVDGNGGLVNDNEFDG